MILDSILSEKKNLRWTIFHILLGALCTINAFGLVIWFYLIFILNFGKSLTLLSKKKPAFFLMLFSYLISFEVLDRMAKTSPFIPYELGKYFLVLLGIVGIIYLGIRSQQGIILVILVTPAIFYDFSGQRVYYDIINYYLGPLAVGLGITFAYRLTITKRNLDNILKLIFWGCLSSVVFTYIKTPDFESINFKLGANFETTAGHSSNQVSTIMGLGMFLSFYSLYNKLKFSGNRFFDGLIFAMFTFQGLLSFSRGGMIVGAFGILLLMFLPENNENKPGEKLRNGLNRSLVLGLIAVISLYGVFQLANGITGGNLLLRYQGETQGTLLGSKEKNVNHITTGRLDIMQRDFELFFKQPLTGVGCGISQYMRDEDKEKVAAHLEFSRLFADHGIFGAIYTGLLFIFLPVRVWKLNNHSISRNILFVLLIVALATSFHAAMRTFVTPLFVILAILKIKD